MLIIMKSAGETLGTLAGIVLFIFIAISLFSGGSNENSYSPPTSNRTYAEDSSEYSEPETPYEVELTSSSGTYTLDADITYVGNDEYGVETVDWPNGGWLSFSGCIAGLESTVTCTDSHNEDYDLYIIAP